ncbi:MAG TPA: ATP phosphoribosyltransferase [Kiritimatiellia bacterium]|nr:ATP phosphoribosyltransferase [Kiritimatiellia bacterium]HPS06588.1 ATP phosphoribosyltransferase [Kiritimatiellia bacterium]
MPVILGLPKGSLQEATFNMMKKAGFSVQAGSRSYVPSVDDPELQCRLIRPQEISRYVELGLLDAGITGYDWIYENNSDVQEVCEMCYSKATSRPVRWVLAVPNDSAIQSVKDLQGKRVATEAVGLTRRYLAQHGVEAEVEFSWGATEVKAPELVDAIVELTETGSSLRANNLRIVDTVLTSTTRLIVNKKAWANPAKRAKVEQLALLLQGALAAESRVLIKLNVPADKLDAVSEILPSLHAPTVNKLNDAAWFAVESVVEEKIVRDIVPPLRAAGATGIIELPLNKVIF